MDYKANKKMEDGRMCGRYRGFKHSNSMRKISDSWDNDRDEALEYTTSVKGKGRSKSEIKSVYDDEYTSNAGKYPVKPKRPGDKKKTIRTIGRNTDDEEE